VTSVAILLLLHEGGWDEVLMVGVGLVLAYVIIMLTGRKGDAEDAVAEDVDEEVLEADEPRERRS
jgi:hypothetical protein